MKYTFEIIGVAPILTFFNYQQKLEQNENRSKAYLGSYECSLDGFIESVNTVTRKPDWDWDDVIKSMVNFWLKNEEKVRYWQQQFKPVPTEEILMARVANIDALRFEFESLLES